MAPASDDSLLFSRTGKFSTSCGAFDFVWYSASSAAVIVLIIAVTRYKPSVGVEMDGVSPVSQAYPESEFVESGRMPCSTYSLRIFDML